jgi:hypothetical protein
MVPPTTGTQIPSKIPTTEILPAVNPAEAMDSAATATAGKNQTKPKKAAKDLMADKCRAKSDERVGRRESARA